MKDFTYAIRKIEPAFRQLRDMDPFRLDQCPSPVPTRLAGVYSLSEADGPLYVGRTRNLRSRLSAHRSRSVRQATLAVKMARRHSDLHATYRRDRSAKYLYEHDPLFKAEFEKAREHISALQVRYVHEDDDVRQALLEIYAAIQLDTTIRYNRFRTS